jgi:uncharacterized membrane protein (DUF106 family)
MDRELLKELQAAYKHHQERKEAAQRDEDNLEAERKEIVALLRDLLRELGEREDDD